MQRNNEKTGTQEIMETLLIFMFYLMHSGSLHILLDRIQEVIDGSSFYFVVLIFSGRCIVTLMQDSKCCNVIYACNTLVI